MSAAADAEQYRDRCLRAGLGWDDRLADDARAHALRIARTLRSPEARPRAYRLAREAHGLAWAGAHHRLAQIAEALLAEEEWLEALDAEPVVARLDQWARRWVRALAAERGGAEALLASAGRAPHYALAVAWLQLASPSEIADAAWLEDRRARLRAGFGGALAEWGDRELMLAARHSALRALHALAADLAAG